VIQAEPVNLVEPPAVAGLVPDETALASRCRTGDRAAFEQLVRLTARGLHAMVYLQTGDHLLAEDITQETYLRAWRSILTLTDPSKFRGWLYAIASKTVVSNARWHKRRKRAGATADDLAMLLVSDPAPPPDELASDQEQRTAALEALRALPAQYRQVLALRYLAGADYQSMARQLSLSNGSLRGLLSRGLSLLRQRLNANEVTEPPEE